MFFEIALLIFGIIFLVIGSNLIVEGAVNISKRLGLSKLFIGMTVVTVGTTTPELIVNVVSALQGNSAIGLGNILGSNLFNLLVIIGLTAIFLEVKTTRTLVKESFFALAAIALLWVFSAFSINEPESTISALEGATMLLLFGIYAYLIVKEAKKEIHLTHIFEKKSIEYLVLGAFLIYVGGIMAVTNAAEIAR